MNTAMENEVRCPKCKSLEYIETAGGFIEAEIYRQDCGACGFEIVYDGEIGKVVEKELLVIV